MKVFLCVTVACVFALAEICASIVQAAEFFCASGNVACLVAAINDANGLSGDHVIRLAPGNYALQSVDNKMDGANGLPSIRGSIRIQPASTEGPIIIERPFEQGFRIFHVSFGGTLILDGVTIMGGSATPASLGALFNRGVVTLQNCLVSSFISRSDAAILNFGSLQVSRCFVADNRGVEGGGIFNYAGGNLLVHGSTLLQNTAFSGGAIFNEGTAMIRDSAILTNNSDCCSGHGGGLLNRGGIMEISNSTLAKNAGGISGGAVANAAGQLFLVNNTITENRLQGSFIQGGAGISNLVGGTLFVQNSVVAGNVLEDVFGAFSPDCSGTITSVGNNLVGLPAGCLITLQSTDLTGSAGLGALSESDESPGKSHYSVLEGSAVIDKANQNACPPRDQLGNLRLGACDIGAIEFLGPAGPLIGRRMGNQNLPKSRISK